MGLIKDIYSRSFYTGLCDSLSRSIPSFDKERFINSVMSHDFEKMEWKQRMQHTTHVFHAFLPSSFAESVVLIEKLINQLKKDGFEKDKLAFIFLPDYIATYGLDDFGNSVKAIEFITQFISCEFAVRPFILKYRDKMMKQMLAWSLHESYQVRRLASEGSRPRLPWAMGLPELKNDPALILPILENLKNDPSEWVRRSVANNLNDIGKDHPDILLKIAVLWKGISKETDAIIKHGSRTLLKQGNPEILRHYGLESELTELEEFTILTPRISIGGILEFSFSITNMKSANQTIRLEYAVYYKKQNGQSSKKVFKISERLFQPKEKATIRRKQKFAIITTRTFYPGLHQLSIIVNGVEKDKQEFELTNKA